jgi:DNA repair photolyase
MTDTPTKTRDMIDVWDRPATIERNNFVFKSLSCWSYNVAVGCEHACRFCYVPSVSTNKLGPKLAEYGVTDPDEQWGEYLMVRQWNDDVCRASLRKAMAIPADKLPADGNRAVMLCTTTDPYQVVRHPDTKRREELANQLNDCVRGGLVHILAHSDLNVRILTRSPLARQHFDIMKCFGKRLLFGMSLPTLNPRLAKVYEPKAPAPIKRLETLQAAKSAGLNVYVAVAPTYPECDYDDLRETFKAIKDLDPVTVFHEPINIRAENVARIAANGKKWGVELNTKVFETPEAWANYAVEQLTDAGEVAIEVGLADRLHLWPDKSLQYRKPEHLSWYRQYWNRISEWPQ